MCIRELMAMAKRDRPTASITLSPSASGSTVERQFLVGWSNLQWKHGKRSHKAFSRYWKRGRSPVAVIPRHHRKKRRTGRRAPSFAAHFPYIMLCASATMNMAAGVSEREAILTAIVKCGWRPDTCSEVDRVRVVLRRMKERRT